MSDVWTRIEREQDDLFDVEAQIRAARNYVVPSNNLRPKVLEAARELNEDRQSTRRLRRLCIALLLLGCLSVRMVDHLIVWHERRQLPTAIELEQRALDMEVAGNVSPHWGLLEAFSQLRRVQAARLGQPALGQPALGQPALGQPALGQPALGQPALSSSVQ